MEEQQGFQGRKKSAIIIQYLRETRRIQRERKQDMNFYDKKVRRIISIITIVVIAAMVLTMVIPYMV